MSVADVTPRADYVGNGSLVGPYAFLFRILAKTDLDVLVDGVAKLVDSDYTVAGVGDAGGGSVTFIVAPANGATITLLRKQPVSQLSDYQLNEDFPSERIEKDFDKLLMGRQQDRETLTRAVRAPKADALDMVLPSVASRKNNVLGFTSAGLPTAVPLPTAGGGDVSLATVLATGSTTARTLAERFAEIINVKDRGAVGDGITDDTTAIQAAIASNRTVVFPPSTYMLGAILNIDDLIDLTLVFLGGATLRALAALGANPLLRIKGAAQRIVIEGGLLDGNSIAFNGLLITGQAERVLVRGVEVKGTTGTNSDGIRIGDGLVSNTRGYPRRVTVEECDVHNCGGTGVALRGGRDHRLVGNACYSNTLDGIGGYSMGAEIAGNRCYDNTRYGIQSFSSQHWQVHDNRCRNNAGNRLGLYFDTCWFLDAHDNWLDDDQKLLAEVCEHSGIYSNRLLRPRFQGLWLAGRLTPDTRSIDDCEDAWTPSTNVVATTDAIDFKEGLKSVQLTIQGAFTTGLAAYFNTGTIDLSTYGRIEFWIKTDTELASGRLSLLLSNQLGAVSPHTTIPLPRLFAGVWRRIVHYPEDWFPTFTNGVLSVGLQVNTDLGAGDVILHLDDIKGVAGFQRCQVMHNEIVQPYDQGIRAEKLIDETLIEANLITEAAFGESGNAPTGIFVEDGVRNVVRGNFVSCIPAAEQSFLSGTRGVDVRSDDSLVEFNTILNFDTSVNLAGTGNAQRGNQTALPADLGLSADNGDASITWTPKVSAPVQRWNTPLTATRTMTLSTTGAHKGDRGRAVREAGATGAFNLNIGSGPLKALTAASQWADFEFDGTAYRLVAAGTL